MIFVLADGISFASAILLFLKRVHTAIKLERLGVGIIRDGLVILILGVGQIKFIACEAEHIKRLVENNPLFL